MRQMSKAKSSQSFATRAIHHGYDPLENEGSLTPPIHMTSTFVLRRRNRAVRVLQVRRRGMSCLLYTSPSPRDGLLSRMPSSA